MGLQEAVKAAGRYDKNLTQQDKKRYAEKLSKALAEEAAAGLREIGFPNVKPVRGGPGEKEFQGGLGPKKVDVSYADERNGLLFALSIKTICYPPFGKNLKNRFGDLCTEAITLHLRFPYSVVAGLFAFPDLADSDKKQAGTESTLQRAQKLFRTISGRAEYTDPGEKFENMTVMVFSPLTSTNSNPNVKLFDCDAKTYISEAAYFEKMRSIFNQRNPHCSVGEQLVPTESEPDED